jgi:putative ABC transport system permease protein
MNALGFAWRSLVRQPARAILGILGVAAVGALLFDMLMLSNGLIVSMRGLLDRTGFDVRVTTGGDLPRGSFRIAEASAGAAALLTEPSVRAALAIRFADGTIDRASGLPLTTSVQGVSGTGQVPWTILRGRDVGADGDWQRAARSGGRDATGNAAGSKAGESRDGDDEVVVNESLATALGLAPGSTLTLRASCASGSESLPEMRLRVAGIAEFPFEGTSEHTVATRMPTLDALCGENARDEAEMILVTSTGDAEATAQAIQRARPDLQALTNQEMLGRFQQTGFTYFRQISTVLITVTLSFALLLITVLLTVSVNQRLGEIAALRALGFSRGRVVADVLCESALIVGIGGLVSIPTGALLAEGLDRILKGMPGIPTEMHFFVFEPQALVLHVVLLGLTAFAAAVYPMRLVATLPIAATLRKEVTS